MQWRSQGMLYGRARHSGHVIAGAYAVQGGSGGMLPQENLNFRPSKAVFGAF